MLLNHNESKIYAIFTVQNYSFAIMKIEANTYFFNSHSCTPQGRHSKHGIGFSSIIRFSNTSLQEINNNTNGANSISEFILKLLIPHKLSEIVQQFSLTRIECVNTPVSELEESIILETQTQVIHTDQNQPNFTESIETIINDDKKMI